MYTNTYSRPVLCAPTKVSTTSANGGIRSSYGNRSRTASCACRWLRSSRTRSFACTAVSARSYRDWGKFLRSRGRQTFQTRGFCATCSGLTQRRTFAGECRAITRACRRASSRKYCVRRADWWAGERVTRPCALHEKCFVKS